MSHSLVEWSRLQLARKSPVSWNATPHTACVCSVNVSVHLAAWKSQSFTVESPEAVAICVPCGWKDRPATQSLWPSPAMIRSPLGMDHSFQVVSSDAVATTGFFGWIAMSETDIRWPLKVFCRLIEFTGRGSKSSFA